MACQEPGCTAGSSSRLKPKVFHLPPPRSPEKLSPIKPVPGAKKVGDRCHRWYAAAAVYSLLCLILCNPTDYSLPGSSVHGILQARILERVAISFSRGSSQPRDWTHNSCISGIGRQVLYHWCHLGNLKPSNLPLNVSSDLSRLFLSDMLTVASV